MSDAKSPLKATAEELGIISSDSVENERLLKPLTLVTEPKGAESIKKFHSSESSLNKLN